MFVNLEFPRTLDYLLDDVFTTDFAPNRLFPALDVCEYENETVVVAELPGVRKEDLKLSIENGWLTISGERRPYEIPQDAKILLNEMRVRNFSRSIQFPHDVDVNNISAELTNGVLRIVLPKTEQARVRTVHIK
jgi:HSP20 family protein